MASTEFTNSVTLTDADWFNDVNDFVYDIVGDATNQPASRAQLINNIKAELGYPMTNGTIAVSVAANALTIALKTNAGTDPSSTNPVFINFRDSTATTGTYSGLAITSAQSLTISSGSTLGTISAQAHRIYVVGVNDGGTFRLGVWNPWNDTNKHLLGINENQLYSSTAEGGAGAADSAHTLYTGTAVTSKAVRILGYFESTQTTAGTWVAEDDKVQLMGPGVNKTGDLVQKVTDLDGAVATGTTTIPADDTIPTATEGDQYLSVAITPTSAANIIKLETSVNVTHSVAGATNMVAFIHRASAAALAVGWASKDGGGAGLASQVFVKYMEIAGGVASITYATRAGSGTAGTITFNGTAGGRLYGGVFASILQAEEIFV